MQLVERPAGRDDLRAVTPVVGAVILVGMVLASAALVVTIGGGMVGSLQSEASTEQASASMDAVASSLDGSGETVVQAPDGGSAYVDSDAGWMRVEVGNYTINETLGTLYYEVDDTTFAYQGGGIFRTDGRQRSTVHRPPPIQYASLDNPTLVMPLINITDGDGPVDGKRVRTVETEHVFPKNGEDTFNPVANQTINVTIHSEFYQAWGDYLSEALDRDIVRYRDTAEAVNATLEGPTVDHPNPPAEDGLNGFTFNEGTELDIRNNVSIDSYDSTEGPYDETGGRHTGHVKSTATEFSLSGGHDGSVTIHGDVDVTGKAEITGQQADVVVYGDTTIGDETGAVSEPKTTVQGNGAGGAVFHGTFSTKEDLQANAYPTFGDDVIVGGSLQHVEATVEGDLYVHGDTDQLSGDLTVEGNVVLAGANEFDESNIDVDGVIVEHASDTRLLDPREPDVEVGTPDVDIRERIDDIDANRDNAGPNDIDGSGKLKNCDSTCELTAGDYYLQDIDLDSGDKLLLNTTEGPIRLGVDGPVGIDNGGEVEVEYDSEDQHGVSLYVDGNWQLTQGSSIEIAGDRSPLFEVFMQHDSVWAVEGGSEFRGIVYGLEESGQRTEISLRGNEDSEFFGAVLGDISQFDKDQTFHRDEALGYGRIGEYDPSDIGDTTPKLVINESDVAYFHIERRKVVVD